MKLKLNKSSINQLQISIIWQTNCLAINNIIIFGPLKKYIYIFLFYYLLNMILIIGKFGKDITYILRQSI